jgi:hypothetical protein
LKFEVWSEIVDHVLKPMGGRVDISHHENIPKISEEGLENLLK